MILHFEFAINAALLSFVARSLTVVPTKARSARSTLQCSKPMAGFANAMAHGDPLLSYVTKQARPDTCAPIAFLMTRVQGSDKDDWKKMVHLMRHVRGTQDMPLVLSANGSHILK